MLYRADMSQQPWNEHYATGQTPWDIGAVDPLLVAFIDGGAVAPGRTLEVGCGTGNDALWLAGRGFEVLGIDVSPSAIEKARDKLAGAPLRCRFAVLDFLAEPSPGCFDFVFDRGCFHVFDEAEERARFVARVAAVLAPGGQWLSLIGSTEGPPRDIGPPRRSARNLVDAIEPSLEIVELRGTEFHSQLGPARAWLCLARQRLVAAQPLTRRS